MSSLRLTSTRMKEGVWEGVIDEKGHGVPQVEVYHRDEALPDVTLTELPEGNQWLVQIPVPVSAISDGIQTFVVSDRHDMTEIGQFHIIAGEAIGDDIRVELDLLRAELDMLKRAFRRHCSETA